jgi:chemotaxis protein MotB
MKPRYFQTEAAGRDRWMISYMDVLTILLIFFVAVAAHGLPALQRASAAPPAPPAPAPAPKEPAPKPVASDRELHPALFRIKEQLEQHGLNLRIEPRGLVISLPQAVLFASGEDQVSREALPIVEEIAKVLSVVSNSVTLVGHADSVPIHNRRFRDNWELSAARGLRLLELLSRTYGIPESRLSAASDGSYQPKGPNDTPDGRAENRRVEIVVLDDSVQPDQ